jgi:hypothetical protein
MWEITLVAAMAQIYDHGEVQCSKDHCRWSREVSSHKKALCVSLTGVWTVLLDRQEGWYRTFRSVFEAKSMYTRKVDK